MSDSPTIKSLFAGLQKAMAVELKVTRQNFPHAPTKGAVSEHKWIKLFREYLPSRYTVDSAHILDSEGNISKQIDIVVFDRQYSTIVLNDEAAKYILAESVYAVFEVKQVLDKGNLEDAAEKVKSVRSLTRTSAPIVQADGVVDRRSPDKILAGFLATDIDSPSDFSDYLHTAIASTNGILDLGCVINQGAFFFDEDTQEYRITDADNALLIFYFEFLKSLQKIGTVPAIDFDKYLEVLDNV
jgi:hypothetical protein